jgi:hypothetical protein
MRFENVLRVSPTEDFRMHKILISLAAAGVLLTAAPAMAEGVGVSIGERGVSVGVGDRDRDVRRDRGESRRVYTDGYRSYGRGDCREITVKKRMPDGTVVIRKSQRC